MEQMTGSLGRSTTKLHTLILFIQLIHRMLLFSCSVMSDSLWPHGRHHMRLPCPSLSPGVCSNSCPLSWWCHPAILPSATLFCSCPQSFPAWVLSNEWALDIRWPKYWSFSFSISHSKDHSELKIRIDWFDLLALQGILKSLFQHHNSKASILWLSALFMVQLSHLYMTIGKTTALTIQIFAGKVIYLPFKRLCRFVIAFLPRSKHLLVSWLQSPSGVILGPKKLKDACSLEEKLWQTYTVS